MRTLVDIETRSVLDLTKSGTPNYACHPSTSITHVGYAIDGGPITVWQPRDSAMPRDLADAMAAGGPCVAHNAAFERLLLSGPAGRAIGFPATLGAPERWSCTAARAAALGLPRRLEFACQALRMAVQKDKAGHALMLRVCRPRTRSPLTWWEDEARMYAMAEYCRGDVACEAELDRRLPELSPNERAIWLVTERMNDRGVLIDQELLQQLIDLVAAARADLDQQIGLVTAGAVPKITAVAALTAWLRAQGLKVDGGIDKLTVAELLERDDLDAAVERALELRQEGGGSSTTKIAAVVRQLDEHDGRIRHALVFAGAPATGRWSSTGVQLQNLPRNTDYDLGPILRDLGYDITVSEIAEIHGPPLRVASELLRPLIVAPEGRHLVIGDYSQIEARVLAWLAGEHRRVAMFREYDRGGPDPYSVTAARLFGISAGDVTPAQRQSGKVAELALGFQGGHRAIQAMARKFGLRVPKAVAEDWKLTWRAANPAIESYWYTLEAAARTVLSRPPGHIEHVGLIQFSRNARAMSVKLPSGRKLTYWWPSLRMTETPWGELRLQPHCYGLNNLTHRWENGALYGGLITENVVQATARDIMADALLRLDAAGFNPILTVHDEIVCEATAPASAVASIMQVMPNWTLGLPSTASVAAVARYMKG